MLLAYLKIIFFSVPEALSIEESAWVSYLSAMTPKRRNDSVQYLLYVQSVPADPSSSARYQPLHLPSLVRFDGRYPTFENHPVKSRCLVVAVLGKSRKMDHRYMDRRMGILVQRVIRLFDRRYGRPSVRSALTLVQRARADQGFFDFIEPGL
jgi:hypothetical protein